MSQSINLIPQEEVVKQKKERVVKFSSIFSIVLLLLVIGISWYEWGKVRQMEKRIEQKEQEIEASPAGYNAFKGHGNRCSYPRCKVSDNRQVFG